MARILVVDDEPGMRLGLKKVLKKEGYTVETADDGEKALARLSEESFDAIVTDLRMPKRDGMSVLEHARTLEPQPLVFMITAYGDVPTAVKAMQAGATDFIMKPFKIDDVRERVRTALLKRELGEELGEDESGAPESEAPAAEVAAVPESAELDSAELDSVFADFPEIIGRSPQLAKALKTVRKIARTRCTVLILGETGTGKELIAQALHRLSPRNEKAFIATANAVSPTLVERELFGHKRGAFTGAGEDKPGYFEAAHGGTLFLDEVGDLPMDVQVKLLRVIQEGEINRVGDPEPRKVDVRLVAATWRDLKQLIAEKRFRDDLYYRLNVITINLPPLRERRGDLALLCRAFLDEQGEAMGRQFTLTAEAEAKLLAHDWPGNIRELKNRIMRMAIYAPGDELDEAVVDLAMDDDA